MAADLTLESDMAPRLSHLDNLKPGPIAKGQQGGMRMGGGISGIPGVSGTTCCANTLEELVDFMDCYQGDAKKKALAEIKRYNALCEKGVDVDFGKDRRILKATALKDPLFYATVATYNGSGMFGLGAGMSATSGLDTDAEGRVLNSEFKPIKGLYAAGNNAGGRFITVYQSPISGISIGMAVTEGYLLGEMLAKL
jgi:predicted oxidoreductase